MNKVITITAQLGNGKDTLADCLLTVLNDRSEAWERASFARSVKQIFCDACGVSFDFIEQWKRNPNPPDGFLLSVRQCLQLIGDGFRKMKSNIWIEIAFRNLRMNSIITDGRYFNEARFTKEKGGVNVLLWRPGFENDDPNPSESQIKPIVDWFVEQHLQHGLEGYIWDKVACPESLPEARLYDLFIVNDTDIDGLCHKGREFVLPYLDRHYA